MRTFVITCSILAMLLAADSAAQEARTSDEPSDPPLHEAIRAGDTPAIQSLLQAGVDPNALVNVRGTPITPLWLALESQPENLARVVGLLLDAGADPNLQVDMLDTPGGKMTPLILALSSLELARLLLEAGADPNLSSEIGGEVQTPLSHAMFNLENRSSAGKGVELVRLLLEAGADPNAPFQLKALLGLWVVDVEAAQVTPLLWAVSVGDADAAETGEVVRLLLDAGADPNSGEQMIDGQWISPLAIALGVGNSDVARILREAGAHGDTTNETGSLADAFDSPLHHASWIGDVAAMQRLLHDGADPDANEPLNDYQWYTPLGAALTAQPENLVDVVRTLLQAGANPDGASGIVGDEVTPLDLAVFTSPDVVQVLLEAGADPNVAGCGSFGSISTPLSTADMVGLQEEADLLRAAGAYDFSSSAGFSVFLRSASQDSLNAAVLDGEVDTVERLLQAGSDPNALIEVQFATGPVDAFAPLYLAMIGIIDGDREFHIDLVRLLLQAGADPNESFEFICGGRSLMPLHMAAASGSTATAQLLLNAGADPNAVVDLDGERFTPLDLATMEGHPDVAAMLRAAGAEEASPPPDAEVSGELDEHFASCTPGATTTRNQGPHDIVRYDILGPEENGCRVAVTHEASRTSEFEHKPMLLTLDADGPFLGEVTEGWSACLMGSSMDSGQAEQAGITWARFDCGGPLVQYLEERRARNASFNACTPGATFTSSLEGWVVTRYDIIGPQDAGCRVSMTYETNPNPEWENKPLLLTLDGEEPVRAQLQVAVEACIGQAENQFECDGPLLEILRR